jgi:hypothetical protein
VGANRVGGEIGADGGGCASLFVDASHARQYTAFTGRRRAGPWPAAGCRHTRSCPSSRTRSCPTLHCSGGACERQENETKKTFVVGHVEGWSCARRTDDAALLDGGLLVGQELAQQIHGLGRGDRAEGFRSFVSHHRVLVQVLQDLKEWRKKHSVCGRMLGGGGGGRARWLGGVEGSVPW